MYDSAYWFKIISVFNMFLEVFVNVGINSSVVYLRSLFGIVLDSGFRPNLWKLMIFVFLLLVDYLFLWAGFCIFCVGIWFEVEGLVIVCGDILFHLYLRLLCYLLGFLSTFSWLFWSFFGFTVFIFFSLNYLPCCLLSTFLNSDRF